MSGNTKVIQVNLTGKSNPLEIFMKKITLEDVYNQGLSKESCFVRCIGINSTRAEYINEINQMDAFFLKDNKEIPYIRLERLEVPFGIGSSDELQRLFEVWKSSYDKVNAEETQNIPLKFNSEILNNTQRLAIKKTLELYAVNNSQSSETIIKNFIIKFLGWIDTYLPKIFRNYDESDLEKIVFPRIVFVGSIKQHEYLFLYFLYVMGCDIFYMNSMEDIQGFSNPVKTMSVLYQCPKVHSEVITVPIIKEYVEPKVVKINPVTIPIVNPVTSTVAAPLTNIEETPNQVGTTGSVRIQMPERPRKNNGGSKIAINDTQATQKENIETISKAINSVELSYEELALYAGSVVMLKVYDEDDKCFKSGSGVVISEKGYILTNYHVIGGGALFGVKFENDDEEYMTNEIIKCHSFNDLAILKVQRAVKPIILYEGEMVPRGKQVVAIGSPLGLFNSVSNGIVSGFRNIGEVSMIQFTAPTSHGSSGGALLDMQGRLIGIITAGFDDGQNLNLAVDFKTISPFVNGLV